jgi:hypothetical protein
MSDKAIDVKQEIQVIDIANAKATMKAFQQFKNDVLTDMDFFVIPSDPKMTRHVKKSGWMKYAMALGITTHVYDERSEKITWKGEEVLAYHFSSKAVAPNGRSAEAIGSASSDEGKPWASSVHGIRAMAQTRAVERAISNLVGGGEVGADELDSKSVDAQYQVKENRPNLSRTMSDAEVTGEQDISDALTGAGLDPQGVAIETVDYGRFVIKRNWSTEGMGKDEQDKLWRKYHDCLKGLGGVYHGVGDLKPELRGSWTMGATV